MDVTENDPSLIDCLGPEKNGLWLDLASPSGSPGDFGGAGLCLGPFSKTIPAHIKTDGHHVILPVHLILQRDQYDAPHSLLPINNLAVETAWKNAFSFHQNSGDAKAPILFKHQVSPKGQFQPFQPLFHCHATRRWFHPPCPQCGLVLTLCRDDALLRNRGLPTYSDSLERFLYCATCAARSAASPFYSRGKTAGMPEVVHDAGALVAEWKHLLAILPDNNDLPCQGCPDINACFEAESLVSKRIVPFSFFPFYMMMFPAPSCRAADFIAMISGASGAAPWSANSAAVASEKKRFLFHDQGRQFLEVLYLKLTFLEQLCRQLMPVDDTTEVQAFDLSLEGIGVDLNPAGAELPAYWSFNVRIFDAVGAFQVSPFAPSLPEAPRLHFLGAIWFRALLVNSRQGADAVYAEVGRLIDQLTGDKGPEALALNPTDHGGVFAGDQIFWVPDPHRLPENWQVYWTKAMRLGFQLVHAGLRTGVSWDNGQFRTALGTLRKEIKDALFSGPVIGSTGKGKPEQADKIRLVLHGILEKWQAQADTDGHQSIPEVEPEKPKLDDTVILSSPMGEPNLPPAGGLPIDTERQAMDSPGIPARQPKDPDWGQDIQETVIFSTADSALSSEVPQHEFVETPVQEPQGNDAIEETVVLRTESSSTPPSELASPVVDAERTVAISAPWKAPHSPSPGEDADQEATMIQHPSGPSPSSSGIRDSDLEATVMITAGGSSAPTREVPQTDDDLAATMVQGAGGGQPTPPPGPSFSGPPRSDGLEKGTDPEATVIINPGNRPPAPNRVPDPSAVPADDDLAATLVETPGRAYRSGAERAPMEHVPPLPPGPPKPPREVPMPQPRDVSGRVASEGTDDDDIMEQTIIIRSDVKKE